MIKVEILSLAGNVFSGEVSHITFPGEIGRFAVYPLHAPIVSSLKNGDIVCYSPKEEKTVISIQSGFVEVANDKAMVCVEFN
jgi:F-type H+-transporting ATPase subunit epsilon